MKEIIINAAEAMAMLKKHYFRGLKETIAEAPEIVRCKDCLYNENGQCTRSEDYDDTRYRPDYFCADGERIDNDQQRKAAQNTEYTHLPTRSG